MPKEGLGTLLQAERVVSLCVYYVLGYAFRYDVRLSASMRFRVDTRLDCQMFLRKGSAWYLKTDKKKSTGYGERTVN